MASNISLVNNMGAAIAKNVSKQIINNSTTIANTYIQKCTGTGDQLFGLTISNGCVANIGKIDIANTQVLNVICVQNSTTTSSMKSEIAAQIAQQALAAAQSIGGPSASFAESIAIFAANASETITNLYTQTCLGNANQNQNIKCTDPSSQLTVGAIDISNQQTEFTNCTANSTTINTLVNGLSDIISQQTNASEANSFTGFIVIFLVVLGIIGFSFIYTLNGHVGWIIIAIIAIIVVVIIVYATLAFSQKLYPFNQKTNLN